MCQFWSEENICFGIGVYKKVDLPTLVRVYALLSSFCGDNGFVYIDNRDIKGDC